MQLPREPSKFGVKALQRSRVFPGGAAFDRNSHSQRATSVHYSILRTHGQAHRCDRRRHELDPHDRGRGAPASRLSRGGPREGHGAARSELAGRPAPDRRGHRARSAVDRQDVGDCPTLECRRGHRCRHQRCARGAEPPGVHPPRPRGLRREAARDFRRGRGRLHLPRRPFHRRHRWEHGHLHRYRRGQRGADRRHGG